MANLKAIYMTEVEYHDGTQWKELLVEKGGSKLSAYSILINEVVLTSPFSIQLIRSYIDQLCDLMPKSPAEKYIILTDSKRGDAWDPQFMAGKASFTAL